jgi:hypothetical protein
MTIDVPQLELPYIFTRVNDSYGTFGASAMCFRDADRRG